MNFRTRVKHNLNCIASSQSGKWQVALTFFCKAKVNAPVLTAGAHSLPPRFPRCVKSVPCAEM